MNLVGPSAGLWMLLVLGVTIVVTGLPVWALLIGVASGCAMLAVATGSLDMGVLAAVPSRIVGLLEHDLLQALPLYVFIGVLLQRMTIADGLFTSLLRLFHRTGSGASLAALSVGALIAPMNGSVASSSSLLSRLVAPRLGGIDAARGTALVGVAATIGVVVPPSLVLILLGDAMLRAHTEATNMRGFLLGAGRVINTRDVFHSALVPALAVLVLWLGIAWWQGRKDARPRTIAPQALREIFVSLAVVATILALLVSVFTGKMFAVEAAATGGVILLTIAVLTRALNAPQWRTVLIDTMALSGALFALLVGATTFSLVFRLMGTDRLITELITNSALSPMLTAALVLVAVALCAWVLDAFEMIFVIIPIVAPALIFKLGDAQQAAVLLLLVLQLSFLIPPMGYAVLMARSRGGLGPVSSMRLLAALAPFVLAQSVVVALVFANPWTVHLLDESEVNKSGAVAVPAQDVEKRMLEMFQPNEKEAPADLAVPPDQPKQ